MDRISTKFARAARAAVPESLEQSWAADQASFSETNAITLLKGPPCSEQDVYHDDRHLVRGKSDSLVRERKAILDLIDC